MYRFQPLKLFLEFCNNKFVVVDNVDLSSIKGNTLRVLQYRYVVHILV